MCVVGGDGGVDGISEKMLFFQKSVYAIKLAIQKNKIQPLAYGILTHKQVYIYIADILYLHIYTNTNGTLER